jgi:hypothetical protein
MRSLVLLLLLAALSPTDLHAQAAASPHEQDEPVGPPPGMKIAREDLVNQMEEAGFRLAAEHVFLPYQYFLVFTVR